MKKRLFLATIAGVFVVFAILSANVAQTSSDNTDLKNIKIMSLANAQVNPNCPTGCVERPSFCYCNGMSSPCWSPPSGSTLDYLNQ
jgi:hypothetical protein